MVDVDGGRLLDVALPGRGHGLAVDPMQLRAAVFARRPGTFAWIVDLAGGQVSHRIAAAPGRRFYGHGQFTADGARLLCSENDYASGDGVIGGMTRATVTGVSVSCPATVSAPTRSGCWPMAARW